MNQYRSVPLVISLSRQGTKQNPTKPNEKCYLKFCLMEGSLFHHFSGGAVVIWKADSGLLLTLSHRMDRKPGYFFVIFFLANCPYWTPHEAWAWHAWGLGTCNFMLWWLRQHLVLDGQLRAHGYLLPHNQVFCLPRSRRKPRSVSQKNSNYVLGNVTWLQSPMSLDCLFPYQGLPWALSNILLCPRYFKHNGICCIWRSKCLQLLGHLESLLSSWPSLRGGALMSYMVNGSKQHKWIWYLLPLTFKEVTFFGAMGSWCSTFSCTWEVSLICPRKLELMNFGYGSKSSDFYLLFSGTPVSYQGI